MSHTTQQRMTPRSPTFSIAPTGVPMPISQRCDAIWQHKYYPLLVLTGLVGTFLRGCTYAVLKSTFCINSACHLWGQQPHGRSDSSRDSWLVSLVTVGEGYHNYHHMYPTDYRNGPRWYHFDLSKCLIRGLYSLRLAMSLRTGSHVEASLARTN